MSCDIFNDDGSKFNVNPLPQSTITAAITHPDKVGVGQQFAASVKLDPGPLNGPVKLKVGDVTFRATFAVTGATEAVKVASGGPNAVAVEANQPTVSPAMGFSLTASAPVGSNVTVTLASAEVVVPAYKITTRCTPVAVMDTIATVAVVSGTVTVPTVLNATTTLVPTQDGFANCAAAKAAGRGTILRSDPAYRSWLDADNDGLACETDTSVAGKTLAKTGSLLLSTVGLSSALGGLGLVLLATSRVRKRRDS